RLAEARLLAAARAHHRQRLRGALVEPARGQLGCACDAHFEARGIGQVYDVVLHAEMFAPHWFAAGACVVVTTLRGNNAAVALGQLLETWIAVTLTETLVAVASAMHAGNS